MSVSVYKQDENILGRVVSLSTEKKTWEIKTTDNNTNNSQNDGAMSITSSRTKGHSDQIDRSTVTPWLRSTLFAATSISHGVGV